MPVRVEKLRMTYHGHLLDSIWVILDGKSSPPILPLLFTTHLSRNGTVYEAKEITDEFYRNRKTSLIEREVSDATIRSYVYCISQFLSYLEYCKVEYQTPGMHASSACSQRFLNHYLNQVLANNLDSYQSLENHRSALVAYYNWLCYLKICPPFDLRIFRTTRQTVASQSNKQHYIQYVSRYSRMALLTACDTLAEKLLMRMGFEVGLRTSELIGLRVAGKNSLLELFEQLSNDDFSHLDYFRYRLEGRFTKGSKSRWIYFDRLLLQDMKRYFETERHWLTAETGKVDSSLFLRTDQRHKGTGIGQEQASRVFKKRAQIAGLNPLLKFHDLRHTFATELYHEELSGPDGRETRSESAALIVVAQRLGHTIGKDGLAPATTTRYIRMRMQMQEVEAEIHG